MTLATIDQMEYSTDALARAAYGGNDTTAWLSGWNYRKSITLSRASGAVTNYQMKLLVGESSGATGEDVDCGGNCLSSFNDLRFTTSDGTTLLDYWIESISETTPNQLATVWIEFDSIGTSATMFCMYYGNNSASAYSNGENTFPFFDDFNGNDLDSSKWYHWMNSGGSYSVSNSELNVTGSGTSYQGWGCKTKFGTNFAFRSRTKISADASAGDTAIFGFDDRSSNGSYAGSGVDGALFHVNDSGTKYYDRYRENAETGTSRTSTLTTYTILEILRNGSSSVIFAEDGSTKLNTAVNVPLDNCGIIYYAKSNKTIKSDWCLVRQWLSTEPSWGTWSTEHHKDEPIVYSEASTIYEGSYSLKTIANTSSLNKTLTRTISSPINLTGKNKIIGRINASRTGSNIKIGFHDSGGTTTEITPNITSSDTWQLIELDISSVADANKDAIDQIIITVVNADSDNTFYLDNFFAADSGDDVLSVSKAVGYAVLYPIENALNVSKAVGYVVLGPYVEPSSDSGPMMWIF